jgi:hypothetical protein
MYHLSQQLLLSQEKHRMRPEISTMMLIEHTHPETARTAVTEHQSHTNPQAAVLTCFIVIYLLDQGYKGSNIIVLTP